MFSWVTAALLYGCSGEPPAPAAPPAAPAVVAAVPPGPPRDVVFIVIDTLRADVQRAADTPILDALAAEGDQVDRAWSSGTWTVPSVISLFTGQSVRQHGWNYSFPRDMPEGRDTRFPPIPAELPTLAEVLSAAGFKTQGIYGNGSLRWKLGFDRGFESWERCATFRHFRNDAEPSLRGYPPRSPLISGPLSRIEGCFGKRLLLLSASSVAWLIFTEWS